MEQSQSLFQQMVFCNLSNTKIKLNTNKAPDRDVKLDKKRYKTINEEDIMQAKDIMLKNKEECRQDALNIGEI